MSSSAGPFRITNQPTTAPGIGTVEGFHRVGVYCRDPWHLEYYVDGKRVRTASGKDKIDPRGYTKGKGLTKPLRIIINMEDQDWRSDEGVTPTEEELADNQRNIMWIDWIRVYEAVAVRSPSGRVSNISLRTGVGELRYPVPVEPTKDNEADQRELGLGLLWQTYRWRIALTWLLVLLENAAMALIPLFIARAIDDLLADGDVWTLMPLASALLFLTLMSVCRRAYDTRAYGAMRVFLGERVVERNGERSVSQLDARLDMAREFVDFLEGHVPQLMTAGVQLLVSFVILLSYDSAMGVSAGVLIAVMAVVYMLFHPAIFRANRNLNEQLEQQVGALESRRMSLLSKHLSALRRFEVKISDIDAALYGLLFLFMSAFVLTNVYLAAQLDSVTAGTIFAVVAYSWEFVESGFALPMTLQQWTRLEEIKGRLNEGSESE